MKYFNSLQMEYNDFVLTVNSSSIIILMVMAIILLAATRFKGESSYAALIIVLTTVPVYTYNVCRSLGWYDIAIIFAPLAYSVNLTLMPLLWLLVHRTFNPHYKFTIAKSIHFLPAIFSLIFFLIIQLSIQPSQYYDFMIHENTGEDTWFGYINYSVLSVQIIGYFFVIFRYLHKVKHYIKEHYTKAELERKVWVPRFISLFAVLFVIVMVCYSIWPRSDTWLLQILNVAAMGYLLYSELEVGMVSKLREIPPDDIIIEAKEEFIDTEFKHKSQSESCNFKEEMDKLEKYARQVEEYLCKSEAYVNPNLSLKDVATATGISSKNLSKAINIILNKSFFDLVNGFRIEKSKALLIAKKERGLTLETIAEKCGFNSRVTYNNAFKKSCGLTTSEWLKLVLNQK